MVALRCFGSRPALSPRNEAGSRYQLPRRKRPQLSPWTRIAVALTITPAGPLLKRSWKMGAPTRGVGAHFLFA